MTTTTKRLPLLLDQIRIATPCNADWDEMVGDERVRFCGSCEKNVYNLSQMTRDEAEALVREKEGRMCVRFYQRKDGTILSADCPVGVRRKRLRQRVWASVSSMTAAAALAFGVLTGRARADLAVGETNNKVSNNVTHKPAMGGVAVPAPPVKLMGKIALPPQPPPKNGNSPKPKTGEAKMGEPAPLMGAISS
jgi:hypothetical protein